MTAGTPFTLADNPRSAIPSSTLATSPSRMACPSRWRTTIRSNSSTDWTRPRVLSVTTCGPVSMRPPGTSVFCACTARETSVTVRLAARRREASSQMLTWRCRPPTTITCPTPSTLSSWRLRTLSVNSVTSRIGRSEETTRVSTGAESGSIFSTVGWRTVRGSCGSTRLTRSRTSWAATSTFFSRRKLATTTDTPSDEVDRSSSRPEMVLTASSIGSETSRSISAGEAPGLRVVMRMVGKSTLGMRSTPSWMYPKTPTTVRNRMRTVANTGRRTQIAASHCIVQTPIP